jgi:uncharacterized membrane protein YfcA
LIPQLAPWQWALGAFCALNVGIAKTGMPGVGILVVPLMVIAVGDARLSAGWLLPVLCTADVFAVWYWRRRAEAGQLFSLAPWTVLGVALGAFALALPERTLRPVVGGIILVMLLIHLRRRLRPDTFPVSTHSAGYGVSAGFATTVANAASPVMNLYLLSRRLPKEKFVATGAWFFFVINLTKLPIYVWHGLISRQSLVFDALMVPAVLAGALAGRWFVHRVSPAIFETLVLVLTALSTLLLFG